MSFDGRDTIVLFDELAYEDVLALAWHPRSKDFDERAAAHLAEQNLRLLQAFDALEEDFKINLLLDLVGELLAASHTRPRAQSVRFNALGASWSAGTNDVLPAIGAHGLLQLYLRDTLVKPLTLPARIASVDAGGQVRATFEMVGELTAEHLEKIVFRNHRRKIAGARVAR